MSKPFDLISKAICAALIAVSAGSALADGPENVFLVVNAQDDGSKLLANYYIALRSIPSRNVVYLSDIPVTPFTTLSVARDRILAPVLTEIHNRNLDDQIDYIVYSSGFPTIVTVEDHRARYLQQLRNAGVQLEESVNRNFQPYASLTGLTYFAESVMADDVTYMALDANNYYRRSAESVLTAVFNGAEQDALDQALSYLYTEDYTSADIYLDNLVRRQPAQCAVHYLRACALAGLGQASRAAKSLQAAIDAGWAFRNYALTDRHLAKCLDDPAVKAVLDKMPDESFTTLPTAPFKHKSFWAPNGFRNSTPDQGKRYYLSAVLGETWYQGNSEKEVLEQLQRSAQADGTRPDGTFFFSSTDDPRTQVRRPNISIAANQLRQHGFKAEVIAAPLPVDSQVVGAMLGVANFDWTNCGSTILPGAYCDDLTGFSASFTMTGQVKLTELIRRGAAASAGTVSESYSAAERSADPMLFLHYAKGCTLAEAFYQSVWGPYQTLLVGDPLCRPWADLTPISATGLDVDRPVHGPISMNLQFDEANTTQTALFIDDRFFGFKPPGERIAIDSKKLSDGYHELRIVADRPQLGRASSQVLIPMSVDNDGGRVEATVASAEVSLDGTVEISVRSSLPGLIVLRQNVRDLDKKPGPETQFAVPARILGRGPVRLQCVVRDDKNRIVASRPIQLQVDGPIGEAPIDPVAAEAENQRRRDEEELKRLQDAGRDKRPG